jgi:hypothetical protein
MAQTCTKCSRVNPAEASYCYYDGSLLEGHAQNGGAIRGLQSFTSHFVFPSGLICRNFDQLAQACQENWSSAVDLLQQGYLETFFGGLGRADLAFAAREAARFPDRDRGLDQLLAKLPSNVLEPPKLHVEPRDVNLGLMQVGDNRTFDLHLFNNGSRLLYGTVTADDCKWLTLGDAPGTSQKVFQFGTDLVVPVQVRGANLRAGTKPLEGRLLIESNGGNTVTITVRCEVPVKPFPQGVLAGAKSPRQIAEKAKAAPKEAAILFENGAVADWYKSNGWTYPVQGPSAAGLGAVQQFFEALGLTAPPKVDINERFITFHGHVGASLRHTLEVKAQEKRPVFAHAISDQPWLVVERANLNGRTATIGVTIPSVPNRPGEILQGRVTVTSNGNQRFVVPVTLNVSGSYGQPILMDEPMPVIMEEAAPVFVDYAGAPPPPVSPVMAVPIQPMPAPAMPAAAVQYMPPPVAAVPVMAEPPLVSRRGPIRKQSIWVHLIPAFVLVLCLVGMVIHDLVVKGEEDVPVYKDPFVAVDFLDHGIEINGQRDTILGDQSLRFGFYLPNVRDEKPLKENPKGLKRLTFFPEGTSNNTCLRIDDEESLLGSTPRGKWTQPNISLGKAHDLPDGKERDRVGRKSVFVYSQEQIQVTQIVEVIPNEQPMEIEIQNKKVDRRRLDTVLVKYIVENKDKQSHKVGIRFLLDTFIGTNDGVPFTIPGDKELCNTKKEFDPEKRLPIPDYIQALEFEDLTKPGTVAHLSLLLPGLEPPSRVTLGAWPHNSLKAQGIDERARGHLTMWEVPFLSMQEGGRKDSAVTMYWKERVLPPNNKMEVGFTYGLGEFEGGGGKIGLSSSNFASVNSDFSISAIVNDPKEGETITIELPDGFSLVEGKLTQAVPAPTDKAINRSTITWVVKPSKVGKKVIKVKTNKGATQSKRITVKAKAGIF